jgi:hypothetical protein
MDTVSPHPKEQKKYILCLHLTADVKAINKTTKNKLRVLSPWANYTDRATAACRAKLVSLGQRGISLKAVRVKYSVICQAFHFPFVFTLLSGYCAVFRCTARREGIGSGYSIVQNYQSANSTNISFLLLSWSFLGGLRSIPVMHEDRHVRSCSVARQPRRLCKRD